MAEVHEAIKPVAEVHHMASAAALAEARALVPALVLMSDSLLSTLLALRTRPVSDLLKAGVAYQTLLERLQLRKLHMDDAGAVIAVDDCSSPVRTVRFSEPVETSGRDLFAWLPQLQSQFDQQWPQRQHDLQQLSQRTRSEHADNEELQTDLAHRAKELLPEVPSDLDERLKQAARKEWKRPTVRRFEDVAIELKPILGTAAARAAQPAATALSATPLRPAARELTETAIRWQHERNQLGVLDRDANRARTRARLHTDMWRARQHDGPATGT